MTEQIRQRGVPDWAYAVLILGSVVLSVVAPPTAPAFGVALLAAGIISYRTRSSGRGMSIAAIVAGASILIAAAVVLLLLVRVPTAIETYP